MRAANKNLKFLNKSLTEQSYNDEGELLSGRRGVILEGSSRSSKTWSSIDMIILICVRYETNCVINIIKETYNEFKTTLYNDFNKRLPMFGIESPFENAKEVQSFKIFGNRINLLGADKPSKFHGAQCDYAYFNEALPIKQSIFDQVEMRCSKFWWMDYNPSVTAHWIFDSVINRRDVGFLHTTFKDNPHVSKPERNKILSYEPWLPGSYEIKNNQILYKGEPVTEKHQPPPHPTNIEQGTADEFMWKVYGLGLRGAMKGIIFNNVEYIDEFPDMGYSYGLDFGWITDPSALVKFGEDDKNIYLELLLYKPIETPEEMDAFFRSIGVDDELPMTADSSDKYTGENKGTVEMVRSLRSLGWPVRKVKKTKSIMFWLTSMKRKKIHIVKNHLVHQARKEQENYRMKEIHGIAINQPIDGWDHFFTSGRYAHMAYNTNTDMY